MLENADKSGLTLANENNLIQNSNTDNLQALIDEVLAENAEKVQEYLKGKKGLMGMFVGEVMKKSKGTADPKLTNQLLGKALN
jgi:aspartyl-tRNA(Asn)/glutamyl-tRNA(Gln) amidotransferase subunit B